MTMALFIRKLVTHAVDCENVTRLARIGLDLAADVLDVRVDGALIRFEGDAVQRIEQLPAREDAPRLARQCGEQLKFGRA